MCQECKDARVSDQIKKAYQQAEREREISRQIDDLQAHETQVAKRIGDTFFQTIGVGQEEYTRMFDHVLRTFMAGVHYTADVELMYGPTADNQRMYGVITLTVGYDAMVFRAEGQDMREVITNIYDQLERDDKHEGRMSVVYRPESDGSETEPKEHVHLSLDENFQVVKGTVRKP